jgi:hypothetical protein
MHWRKGPNLLSAKGTLVLRLLPLIIVLQTAPWQAQALCNPTGNIGNALLQVVNCQAVAFNTLLRPYLNFSKWRLSPGISLIQSLKTIGNATEVTV